MRRIARSKQRSLLAAFIWAWSGVAGAASASGSVGRDGPALFGIPVDFILFGLILLGVALFHHHTLKVALTGLIVITGYKIIFTGFRYDDGVIGWVLHLQHEWVILTNLLCLLMGFALLSKHFEESKVPAELSKFLPDDWKGGFVLLIIIFVLSGFLDNIAAAIIGGTMASVVFRGKVHIGYLAAIVAASNAGGAGSVVGDTTTTMMWIDGVSPLQVLEAYVAAGVALFIFGIPAAFQQQKYSPITKDAPPGIAIDWTRVGIVAFILIAAIVTNVVVNLHFNHLADHFPFIGVGVWVAILLSAPLRRPTWRLLPESFKGSIFLLSLILCASMMPVEKLPTASWQTALGLGFLSSVFDNIPLTTLALKQGGYDWGYLAYAVGFGGSMIWFGSSAGVALSNLFPEAKSVGAWLRHGWHIAIAYVIGFAALLLVLGWQEDTKRARPVTAAPSVEELPLPPRFGFVKTPMWNLAEADTREAFEELSQHLGGHVEEVQLPEVFNDAVAWHRTIMEADIARSFELEYTRGKEKLSSQLIEMIERGQQVRAIDYNHAADRIPILNILLNNVFNRCNAILTPAAPGVAPVGL